jgi:hypothetical protein
LTYASGYTQPTGTNARLKTNYRLLDDDLTTEDAGFMGLAYDDTVPRDRGIPVANQTIIGSGVTTAHAIRLNTGNGATTPKATWLGADEDNGAMGSHGVLLASRKGGVTALTKRDASGISDTTTTASLTGTYVDNPITVWGSSYNSSSWVVQASTAKLGAAGILGGLDSDERASFTLAVKTLWEATSGLTL